MRSRRRLLLGEALYAALISAQCPSELASELKSLPAAPRGRGENVCGASSPSHLALQHPLLLRLLLFFFRIAATLREKVEEGQETIELPWLFDKRLGAITFKFV